MQCLKTERGKLSSLLDYNR